MYIYKSKIKRREEGNTSIIDKLIYLFKVGLSRKTVSYIIISTSLGTLMNTVRPILYSSEIRTERGKHVFLLCGENEKSHISDSARSHHPQ